jgi:hypothetical protein
MAWQEGYFEVHCRITNDPWTKLALWFFSLEDKNAWNTGSRNCSILNAEWDMIENGGSGNAAAGRFANDWHVSNIGRNTNSVCSVSDFFRTYNDDQTGQNLCDWHTWAGKWTATRLYTYLDGVLLGSAATFDTTAQAMPFIISAATINGIPLGNPPVPDFIVTEVDWFRVWQHAGGEAGGGIGSSRRSTLYLPGTSGAYASTPDHPSLHVPGTIDIRIDLSMADWSPAVFTTLVCRNDTNGERSWQLGMGTTGRLEWRWYTDGTETFTAQSTAPGPGSTLVNGERRAMRVVFKPDNGAAGRTATFYTAPTMAGTWTQYLSAVTTTPATTIHGGIDPVEIGSHDAGTGNLMAGVVHAVEIRDGENGPVVAHFDATDKDPGVEEFTDETGKTWVVVAPAVILPGNPKPDIYLNASPLRLG